MNSRVKVLVQEATKLYKRVRAQKDKQGRKQWACRLCEAFESNRWNVDHPGSDKWIAIKERVIAKWIGHCEWSDNAIRDELELHRRLKKEGFARYLPKMYARRSNVFVVEQLVNGELSGESLYETSRELSKAKIWIADFCTSNVKAFMGIPKIIDGRLRNFCEDECIIPNTDYF